MESVDLKMDAGQPHAFTYHPMKKGIRKVLGDLEADIMEILWSWGQGTVRDVYNRLNKDRPLAYTTIMTVMSRLAKKRLLVKEKAGSAYVYHPMLSRDRFMQATINRIITGLLGDFSLSTITQFVESVDVNYPDQIDELARQVAEIKRIRVE